MSLSDWHQRLKVHFDGLRNARRDTPIFVLDHGLDTTAREEVRRAVRHAAWPPSGAEVLPWLVHAAEIGYDYAGGEYWPTFAEQTPRWTDTSDAREWLRDRFQRFQRQYGGAAPSGAWAETFSIICWPLTHAIIPRDLQRQLARVLYDLRSHLTGTMLSSPQQLGELIGARSWEANSRFRALVHDETLIGHVAAALLLDGHGETGSVLLPSTLARLSADIDRERLARAWLRDARRYASQARFDGLARPAAKVIRRQRLTGTPRNQAESLGLEPKLVLHPLDAMGVSWEVILDLPDLLHLLPRLPEEAGETLKRSGWFVAGSSGRRRPGGGLLNGSQQITLRKWPRADEPLLRFERPSAFLQALLTTECLLRPGPVWLFRVATTDGLAYEVRSLRVRPGQSYVVLRTDDVFPRHGLAQPITVSCAGVRGLRFTLPEALSHEDAVWLKGLGLAQDKTIRVWPAGLAAAGWDGEGRGEWFEAETPIVAIRSDHPLESVTASLESESPRTLDVGPLAAGASLFLEVPDLPPGLHKLTVRARPTGTGATERTGELDLFIRDARRWPSGIPPQGPFRVRVEPPAPTLEEFWEGKVEFELGGPRGHQITCSIRFREPGAEQPLLDKSLAFVLPVSAANWAERFAELREARGVRNAYEAASACEIEIRADELGTFRLSCERELTPLRWMTRSNGTATMLRFIDQGDAGTPIEVEYSPFEAPDRVEHLASRGWAVFAPTVGGGGLYFAHSGETSCAVIVPPIDRDLRGLASHPSIADRERSSTAALRCLTHVKRWAGARHLGDIISLSRRREVLRALCRHLFFILGDASWENSEEMFARDGVLMDLKRAVSSRLEERSFASGLLVAVEQDALGGQAPADRARHFTTSANRYLRFTSAQIEQVPKASVLGTTASSGWLCEFAMRLASDPVGATKWAGDELKSGLDRLIQEPTLARAARFVVLAVERGHSSPAGEGPLYAGWGWE